jgi:hypothetical protein
VLMKKILFTVFILTMLVMACSAQENIHYINEATLVWDPVIADENGVPFAPTDIVTYDVYIYNSALTIDDQNPANLISMGNTAEAQLLMGFTGLPRALYWAGVRCVVETDTEIVLSDIAWSYDEVATNPTEPFGYIPLEGVLIVPAPKGLRDSGM